MKQMESTQTRTIYSHIVLFIVKCGKEEREAECVQVRSHNVGVCSISSYHSSRFIPLQGLLLGDQVKCQVAKKDY